MAYYTHTYTDSTIERLLERTADLFHNAASRYAQYRIYHSTLSELRSLSERDLADLGMSRAMLRGVARQAALDSVAR